MKYILKPPFQFMSGYEPRRLILRKKYKKVKLQMREKLRKFNDITTTPFHSFFHLPITRPDKWDRIEGLQLWRFGKLNSTYHGKLWQRSITSTAALCIAALAAVDKRLI